MLPQRLGALSTNEIASWVLLFFITWHESDLGKGEKNPDYNLLP